MQRRQLLATTTGLASAALLTSCGAVPIPGVDAASGPLKPTAESMLKAAQKLLASDKGKVVKSVVAVIASSKGISLLTDAGRLKDDGMSATQTGASEKAYRKMKPTPLDAMPFDQLAECVGTGEWAGAIAMLEQGPLVGGKAKTLLNKKEIKPFDKLTTPEALTSLWDEAMLLTDKKFQCFTIEPQKAAVKKARGEESFSYLRLAQPGPYGLIDLFEFVSDPFMSLQADAPALTGEALTAMVEQTMAEDKADWSKVNVVQARTTGFKRAGVTDVPALFLLPHEAAASGGMYVLLDPAAKAKIDEATGQGQPDLTGKKAPDSLPGGWQADDNYTIAPKDRTMRETSDTFMFSYRRGESVVSITFHPGTYNTNPDKFDSELKTMSNVKAIDGWQVGMWGKVPRGVRRYANNAVLSANVRPANPASMDDFVKVISAFHQAVTA